MPGTLAHPHGEVGSSPTSSAPSAIRPGHGTEGESTRRRLSDRQARTVDSICAALVAQIHDEGYADLTIRKVARRAGVAPATAYTYFSSREHLVTEVFWRRVRDLEESRISDSAGPAQRAVAALGALSLLVADDPPLAEACSQALLAPDPEVRLLRDRIGREVHRRLVATLGADADPGVVKTLVLAVFGALLQAGMGHLTYEDLPAEMASVVDVVVGRGIPPGREQPVASTDQITPAGQPREGKA